MATKKRKAFSLRAATRAVQGVNGTTTLSDDDRAGVVLLAAASLGANVRRVAAATGFRRAFVAECSRNLRKSGVWRGANTYADWDDGIAFMLDVMVARGLMERSK